MQTIQEKIAYLKGLIKGSEFYGRDENAKAVWEQVLGILSDLAEKTNYLGDTNNELEEYLEALDADLADLEEEIYAEDEIDDIDFVEVECPNCQELISFEEDFLYDDDVEITCPECGEVIYVGEDYAEPEEFDFGDDGDDDSV